MNNMITIKILDSRGMATEVQKSVAEGIEILKKEMLEKRKWLYINGTIVTDIENIKENELLNAYEILLMNELLGG